MFRVQINHEAKFNYILQKILIKKLQPAEMLRDLLKEFYLSNYQTTYVSVSGDALLIKKMLAILSPGAMESVVFFRSLPKGYNKEINPFLKREGKDVTRYFILHLNLIDKKEKLSPSLLNLFSLYFFVYKEYQHLIADDLFKKLNFKKFEDVFKDKISLMVNYIVIPALKEDRSEEFRLSCCNILFRLINYVPTQAKNNFVNNIISLLCGKNVAVNFALLEIVVKIKDWFSQPQHELIVSSLKQNLFDFPDFYAAEVYHTLQQVMSVAEQANFQLGSFPNIGERLLTLLNTNVTTTIRIQALQALGRVQTIFSPDLKKRVQTAIEKLIDFDTLFISDCREYGLITLDQIVSRLPKFLEKIKDFNEPLIKRLDLIFVLNHYDLISTQFNHYKSFQAVLLDLMQSENEHFDIKIVAASVWLSPQSLSFISSKTQKLITDLCFNYLQGESVAYCKIAAEMLARFNSSVDNNNIICKHWFDKLTIIHHTVDGQEKTLINRQAIKVLWQVGSILPPVIKSNFISWLLERMALKIDSESIFLCRVLASHVDDMTPDQKRLALAIAWNNLSNGEIEKFEMTNLLMRISQKYIEQAQINTLGSKSKTEQGEVEELPQEMISHIAHFTR